MEENKDLFDVNGVLAKDKNGATAIHYCCKGGWGTYPVLDIILERYRQAQNMSYSKLMFLRDNDGKIPYDYAVNGGSTLAQWILDNCFTDITDKKERLYQQLMMFFNVDNKHGIRLCDKENCTSAYNRTLNDLICSYFKLIDVIDDNKDLTLAGHCLIYLNKHCLSIIKLIVKKARDAAQLAKILSVKNGDQRSILYCLCFDKKLEHVIEYYLDEVIPNDHPILVEQDPYHKNTALMNLVKIFGSLYFAEKLLKKITKKEEKLRLIAMKDENNQSILDWAKESRIPNVVQFLENQINSCK